MSAAEQRLIRFIEHLGTDKWTGETVARAETLASDFVGWHRGMATVSILDGDEEYETRAYVVVNHEWITLIEASHTMPNGQPDIELSARSRHASRVLDIHWKRMR